MDRTKDVNFTNVRSNQRATFSNGLMQVVKIHRLVELGRVALQHREIIFQMPVIMEIMLVVIKVEAEVKVGNFIPDSI